MATVDASPEPRRSLRRPTQERKFSSDDTSAANGRKRSVYVDDDAPVLDSSFSGKEEELEDEEEESRGPPPLKKVARTSAGGGAIMWKTTTGAPKQLAFKKAGAAPSNGSSVRPTTVAASAGPVNLATALAGLLPEPTISKPSFSSLNSKRIFVKQPAAVPRLTFTPSTPSTSQLVRRSDKVSNEVCGDCVKALPTLRRSLGRLETRMEAVTSMIKQIVNKHSQQNVAFARPSTLLSRGPSTMASSSSSLNGNRVPGNPTAMRFVPIGGRNVASTGNPGMKKFVAEKTDRLSPGSLMYRMISRGLLTYRSGSLTVEEYYKQAPTVIKAHTLKQVQQVMADLVANGLYKKSDPAVDTMDTECIFEKERELSKLSRLMDYGVNSVDFLSGCFDD